MNHFIDDDGKYLGGYDIPPEGGIIVNCPPDDARCIFFNGQWTAPAELIQDRLTSALNAHLDAVAGERRYDNRFTCSLRAGYEGPFQDEGLAFSTWMDLCNFTAYTIMAECKAGTRPVPTEAELIAAMPVMVWPDSPIPEGAV